MGREFNSIAGTHSTLEVMLPSRFDVAHSSGPPTVLAGDARPGFLLHARLSNRGRACFSQSVLARQDPMSRVPDKHQRSTVLRIFKRPTRSIRPRLARIGTGHGSMRDSKPARRREAQWSGCSTPRTRSTKWNSGCGINVQDKETPYTVCSPPSVPRTSASSASLTKSSSSAMNPSRSTPLLSISKPTSCILSPNLSNISLKTAGSSGARELLGFIVGKPRFNFGIRLALTALYKRREIFCFIPPKKSSISAS